MTVIILRKTVPVVQTRRGIFSGLSTWILKHVRFTSAAFRKGNSPIAGIAMRCRAKNIPGFLIPMYHRRKGDCNWKNRRKSCKGEGRLNRDELMPGHSSGNDQKPEIGKFDLCRTRFR